MANSTEQSPDSMPNLDDLLQCPVCYEIPTGQIFQCNEGHHVCGHCKSRLSLCPVCRSMFFGTRNYAMEELIANVRKLQAFKLGGKMTVASSPEQTTAGAVVKVEEDVTIVAPEVEEPAEIEQPVIHRAALPCKGLFRCLCCTSGAPVRLPSGRLLNHLRYYHCDTLIEGKSENGQYTQAWQLPTEPTKTVIALRITDMGQFFVIIEMKENKVYAWMSMAASTEVAHEFSYTVTLSGRDREAYFNHSVVSVRSCEGTLKKRSNCLMLSGVDAHAVTEAGTVSVKLTVKREPLSEAPPRAVLRVASRGERALEPLIQGLQEDVERLTRAFTSLGRSVSRGEARLPQLQSRLLQSLNEPLAAGDAPPAARARSVRRRPRNRR